MAATPFVFIDRSLGRVQVPRLLRASGIEVVTLAEHYANSWPAIVAASDAPGPFLYSVRAAGIVRLNLD